MTTVFFFFFGDGEMVAPKYVTWYRMMEIGVVVVSVFISLNLLFNHPTIKERKPMMEMNVETRRDMWRVELVVLG